MIGREKRGKEREEKKMREKEKDMPWTRIQASLSQTWTLQDSKIYRKKGR